MVRSSLDVLHTTLSPLSPPTNMRSKDVTEARVEASASRDPNIVDWDRLDDAENPKNWGRGRVIVIISLVSALTFLSALSSSIFAPGIPQVLDDFGSKSSMLGSFTVSIFVIGYGVGPLFLAPLSEIYGRLPVYHVCNCIFVLFSAACALAPSLPALLVLRLFAGLAGSCPLALSAGTIADVTPYKRRGMVTAWWTVGPLIGPVIGPIGGGYLIQAKGWRWSFWLMTIVAGVVFVLSLFSMRETYAYTILDRKARRLRKETGNKHLRSALDEGGSAEERLRTAITRPTKMLVCSPVILLISVLMFMFYGYFYLIFTVLPPLYEEEYGFSTGQVGLTFLGLGIGSLIATAISGLTADKLALYMNKAGGEPQPEYRLPLLVLASCIIPIGLFWIGWTADSRQHWILPIIGSSVLSIGITFASNGSTLYLIDAYGAYSASAVAACIILRSMGGALLPLAGGPMFEALGMGWGGSVLAFIAIALIPVPILFLKYGERIRWKILFNVRF
ncbi:hypothetical protein JDV02_004655 [Purpureocillium takamizusanense]|uniref:Major facilitator superfamily (MFS) profile domain-containing protein n=1 Tax=Purpureocillium takamizusanense TaxID=2060973 RepID=A0A9Q8QCX3_9HYPO|nr:uncharacterized protein JDV02_004655 [Purpureocillium takamizusanense]UNI18384.1 hypothetical protein JDV02_004655 [Purpureocillium takamizusanense]